MMTQGESQAFTLSGIGEESTGHESTAALVGQGASVPTSASTQAAFVDPAAVEEVLCAARRLFEQRSCWPDFYRAILGPEGLINRLFTTPEAQTAFRRSKAYGEIQRMFAALTWRKLRRRRAEQPVKIITVRVPESVHAELAREAARRGISVNQLCVAKLVQLLEAEALSATPEGAGSAMVSAKHDNSPRDAGPSSAEKVAL